MLVKCQLMKYTNISEYKSTNISECANRQNTNASVQYSHNKTTATRNKKEVTSMTAKYTKKQLNSMTIKQLQPIALKLAIAYYNSGYCHISFGSNTPEQAALTLVIQASKTSLIKDIMSLQKKIA